MRARQREPERIVTPRLKMADWCGTIAPVDGVAKANLCDMSGSLICSATGWRLAVAALFDEGKIYLSTQFDGPLMADDAAPWSDEHELAKPHETRAAGYVCEWTGFLTSASKGTWAGEIGDRYGGRLAIEGKAQGAGVISLRAAVSLDGARG